MFSRRKAGPFSILLATTPCAEAAERPCSDARITSLFLNIEFSCVYNFLFLVYIFKFTFILFFYFL